MASLVSFQGGFLNNFRGMFAALHSFNQYYGGLAGLQHNLSFYGLVKLFTMGYYFLVQHIHDIFTLSHKANELLKYPYLISVAIMFSAIVIYVIYYEHIFWKNVYLLTASMLLFTHVSFDYRLIYLLFPFVIFLESHIESPLNKAYLVLFSLLLIPHNYIYIIGDISTAVIIYPTIMMILAALIFFERYLYSARA